MPWLSLILTLAAAAPGLLLLIWAIRGDRSKGRKRCPRCWYDMSAAPSPTCPECGHTTSRSTDLLRPRRRKKWAIVAAILLVALPLVVWSKPVAGAIRTALQPKWSPVQEVRAGKYNIQLLRRNDDTAANMAVVIRYSNRVIARHEGMYLSLGGANRYDAQPRSVYGIAQDINSDGIPELIITQSSGGTGCFERHFAYTLPDQPDDYSGFRPVAVFDLCGYWDDLDNDGSIEFIGHDRTFSYRWTSGAGSPYPLVIFRITERYGAVIADDLMLASLITEDELESLITQARSNPDWFGHIEYVLRQFLDLVYTGNEAAAWRFYDSAFDPLHFGNPPDYAANLRDELRGALAQSPFHLAIKGLQDRRR